MIEPDYYDEACFNLNITKMEMAQNLKISRHTHLNWHKQRSLPLWALYQMGFVVKVGELTIEPALLDLFTFGDILSKYLGEPKARFPEIFTRNYSTILKWDRGLRWPLWALEMIEGLEIQWQYFEREI